MIKRYIAMGALGAVIALTAATFVQAADEDPSRTAGPKVVTSAGTAYFPCEAGWSTRTGGFTPLDDSTADNASAATATFVKTCVGPVTATFSSEFNGGGNADDYIHVDVRATCVSGAGMRRHCSVGSKVWATPDHVYMFEDDDNVYHNGSMTFVFPDLKVGKWKFEVKPGGDGASYLNFRTLFVQTFQA